MLNLSSEPRQARRSLKMRRSLIAIILFLASFAVSADSCIDINTASLEELEKIKHIGESRAKQIITLREEKPFSSVDELDRVVGIGPTRVADIKQEGLACVKQKEPVIDNPVVDDSRQQTTTTLLLEVKPQLGGETQIIYPSGIIINEIMPSPEGADEVEEWIEIFNQNYFEADLSGWQIADAIGKSTAYAFPAGTKIPATGFLIIKRQETKIILNNDGDGLNLTRPDGKIVYSVNYEKAIFGQSYGLINSDWIWSANPTPGKINKIPALINKPASAKATAGEAGLAAVSESIAAEQNRRSYPLLAALAIAILSGFVILFLKHVRT